MSCSKISLLLVPVEVRKEYGEKSVFLLNSLRWVTTNREGDAAFQWQFKERKPWGDIPETSRQGPCCLSPCLRCSRVMDAVEVKQWTSASGEVKRYASEGLDH